MTERKLIYSAWRTPDGTILHSKHRHDYVTHFDSKSKEVYALDGGCEYVRCTINKVPPVDLSVYSDEPHQKKRGVFTWGTRRDGEVQWILLQDLDSDHIEAILETQHQIPAHIRQMFIVELGYREEGM